MNKWLHKFMEKPDISDNTDKWDGNLENMHGVGPDKPDRFDPNLNMSGLSGRAQGLLDEKKVENNPRKGGDKSDRFKLKANMSPNEGGLLSVLSAPTQEVWDQNLENIPESKPDITDKTNAGDLLSGSTHGLFGKTTFTFSKDSNLLDEYEERLAIAEYDGHQNTIQAHRIAYLDAFIAVLLTLPYEDGEGGWLNQRIKAAQVWLLDQGIMQPE